MARIRIDRVTFAAALARADLNVKQLAELSGVSRVTISSVKSGKTCSQDTANKLVSVLGSDIIENTAATVGNVK
ncbi:helix-turn-helix transcriptional regulator [Oscillospiraceae bacterium 42-9]